MNPSNEKHVPEELQHVVERLRQERPEATAMELDQIKLRAMARANNAPTLASSGKGQFMKSRLISVMLAGAVLAGGTGAMAATGGGWGGVFKHRHTLRSAPQSQYCPPKSQRPGKPKKPRPARCGKGPKP
jgi:hypothetical protein